jgi:RNA binding exosome subunit
MKLNMKVMTIQEIDPSIVMKHLNLTPELVPFYACITGDLQTTQGNIRKVREFFGRQIFPSAARFLHKLEATTDDEKVLEIISHIFGEKTKPDAIKSISDVFKITLKSFKINEEIETKVDKQILDLVKNDFMSIGEEILLNLPIFIIPTFLDMSKTDMKSINDLAIPLIQKTTGVLLKNLDDVEPRKLVVMETHNNGFVEVPVVPIYPEFCIPSLDVLLRGDMSTIDKKNLLFWITNATLKEHELMAIPQNYLADVIILIYLMNNECLTLLDARCILKTLVDADRRAVPLEVSTEYPEVINERALRCSFLYSKMYFLLHSCLSSLGMKHLCREIQFDGVYFQKIYALNISGDRDEKKLVEEISKSFTQSDIIDEFSTLIDQ